ncbi:MAG: alpha/beta fold hydrolase [Fimbriimonadaceae bacterium]|nr:alpha/beta fold hydrolase [Fimbriimonadaceae bacterium]
MIEVLTDEPASGSDYLPGTRRLTYRSASDGAVDWALWRPGEPDRHTVVYLHGSFSHADQIFTRRDVREFWLTRIVAGGHPLLSLELRGNAYMSPAATADCRGLLEHARAHLGCQQFVLLGGSGGASSALAFAVQHPERLAGVVAMGMCDIVARLEFARRSSNPVLTQLAADCFAAYGALPEEQPALYAARSVLLHHARLTMPVVLTMGECDALIPVAETRRIAAVMRNQPGFVYHEIAGGDHDSALWIDVDLQTCRLRG